LGAWRDCVTNNFDNLERAKFETECGNTLTPKIMKSSTKQYQKMPACNRRFFTKVVHTDKNGEAHFDRLCCNGIVKEGLKVYFLYLTIRAWKVANFSYLGSITRVFSCLR
jgi:hypothetical protein